MATTEQEMIAGLDSEGATLYKHWNYAAKQLFQTLTAYNSIDSTTTASTAIERAIKELTKMSECERDKWDKFVTKCFALNADPELANS